MKLFIGSDHAGFEIKNKIIDYYTEKGLEVINCGAFSYNTEDDYPKFCIETAEQVIANNGSLGIVIGGSGNGEQIAANKVKGIRCALAWNEETARLAREHNDAQVISVGARMHSEQELFKILDTFLTAKWSKAERHSRRINQILEYENTK